MNDFESQIRELRERTDTNRREFLRLELQTCSIALERARWELALENTHEAEKEVAIVCRGTQVIARLISELPVQLPEIEGTFAKLKSSTESLRWNLDRHPP